MNKFYWLGGLLSLPILIFLDLKKGDPLLFEIGTIILFLICIVVNTFVGIYLFRNWKETVGGRAIMYSMGSLAVLADLSLLTTFLGPDWPGRGALRVFIFGGILIAHTHLLSVLIKAPTAAELLAEERRLQHLVDGSE